MTKIAIYRIQQGTVGSRPQNVEEPSVIVFSKEENTGAVYPDIGKTPDEIVANLQLPTSDSRRVYSRLQDLSIDPRRELILSMILEGELLGEYDVTLS